MIAIYQRKIKVIKGLLIFVAKKIKLNTTSYPGGFPNCRCVIIPIKKENK